jgi:5-formyltetrahydrofolate cyclo-ligase
MQQNRAVIARAAPRPPSEDYDSERLRLDAAAMSAMGARSQLVAAAEAAAPGSVQGAWKWELRKRIWDMLEDLDLADQPR